MGSEEVRYPGVVSQNCDYIQDE